MSFGFSFGGSKSKSKSNPWAEQTPYLTGGFQQAQDTLNSQGQSPYANVMGQYGSQMAPGIGDAMGFNQSVLGGQAGQFSNAFEDPRYQQTLQDYWQPQHQMAADNIRAQTVEGLRRSDWGDAMGASLAGFGTGADSSPYVKARLAQSEQATQGYQNALTNLHQGAFGQAQHRADQWAGADMGNQYAGFQNQAMAAGNLGQMGMQGVGMQNQQYNQPWQDLGNYWNIVGGANWGGTTKGKEASFGISGKG